MPVAVSVAVELYRDVCDRCMQLDDGTKATTDEIAAAVNTEVMNRIVDYPTTNQYA